MEIRKQLIIIGAGPAGLKAGEEAERNGLDYIILEKDKIGQSWRNLRPGMLLLSPCHPQRDWTSLSHRLPIWKYPVKRPYCTIREFVSYLEAFKNHFDLEVRTHTPVTGILPKDGGYRILCSDGTQYLTSFLVLATGVMGNPYIPPIPGIKNNPYVIHSGRYKNASRFKKKRIVVVGGGNSAAEIAIELAGYSIVHLVTRSELKYFSQTDKLYHIRGIYESYLKELIRVELIRYHPFREIERIENKTVFSSRGPLEADKIIFATGYRAHIGLLHNFNIRVDEKGWPEVTEYGESRQYPNLYFGGPLSYQRLSSNFIHGFVRQTEKTIREIANKVLAKEQTIEI